MSIFFGFGGSVLDTDCGILQLGGLYTFIASELWPKRYLISLSSNPELNKIVHNVTFPEWFMLGPPYQIIRLYRYYYRTLSKIRCKKQQFLHHQKCL